MNRFVYPGAISMLAWLILLTPANAQDLLKTGVQDFEARSNMNAYGLCGNMKALCGCVFAEGDSNDHFNTVKIDGITTTENVLNEIIQKNPKYKWSIEDGVINIVPKKEFRHLVNGKDPLETIIDDFTIDEKDGAGRYAICDIKGLNCHTPYEIAGIRELCSPISLHLKKVTLREALNKIVKADGMASWKLEYGNDKQAAIDIHCWREGRRLWDEDAASLKIISEAMQQPINPPVTRPYWLLFLMSASGLVILYFIVRTFRAKIKPQADKINPKTPE